MSRKRPLYSARFSLMRHLFILRRLRQLFQFGAQKANCSPTTICGHEHTDASFHAQPRSLRGEIESALDSTQPRQKTVRARLFPLRVERARFGARRPFSSFANEQRTCFPGTSVVLF